jgi:branched-chain amino acid transport system ATP-binding protein
VAALEVREVSVRFGGHLALDRASFVAEAGRITGLIGPNGAGKTTMFNAITGLVSPSSGWIFLGDRDVSHVRLHRRARAGLARTFQQLELFTMLTVRENIRVAADVHRRWSRDPEDPAELTEAIIERVGLGAVADARVTQLPTGQGRLVELGRALACKPRVLLLDEPASGQDDTETARFGALLSELAATGTAVVLVEHDMSLVMDVCDTVHVLDLGHMIASGDPASVQSDPAVLQAYLGTSRSTADGDVAVDRS